MMYYVAEVTSPHSFAKAERIHARNRTIAKRLASRYQLFLGTVLYLGRAVDSNDFITEPIAVKRGNRWIDLDV